MTKGSERVERFILYSSMISLNLASILFYIIPLDQGFSQSVSVILCLFSGLSLLYATLCLCYRGFITETETKELASLQDVKSCHICMMHKPERSHHCSSCKRCIKKMDHHCHWLGRCINYHNHGHFIRFILFMFLDTALIVVYNIYLIYLIFVCDLHVSYNQSLLMIAMTSLAGLMVVVSGTHFYSQLTNAIFNVTFIETMQCDYFGFLKTESPYNIGLSHNLREVFGPFKFLFLLGPNGNGIEFKKKKDLKYWPKHFQCKDSAFVDII